MISETKATFIEEQVLEGEGFLYEVTVPLTEYNRRYTAVRAKLKQEHPNFVVTNWRGFPAFLNERKNPINHTYKFTVLTHERVNRGGN